MTTRRVSIDTLFSSHIKMQNLQTFTFVSDAIDVLSVQYFEQYNKCP